MVIFGGDACVRALGNRLLGIIRCDGGDMTCTDIFLDGITMLGGCSQETSVE